MWSELKSNLYSSRVYLFELVITTLFIILLMIIIVGSSALETWLILLLICSGIILLNFLGKKRKRELEEIKRTINNIRQNVYTQPEEIKLGKNLMVLEGDIKLMFEKVKGDIESMKRLQRVRSEFLGNVSHELRTPIFAIQGYLETLLGGAINDAKVNKYFIEKANQHTVNLNNLLNDLIDISMIESGEMRMSFRYFKIDDYLKSFANEIKPFAEEKNLELVYKPVRESLQLFGDKDRLRQVLNNLVQNAVKYTEKGKIEIFAEEEAKTGKITVKDTGIGIPDEDLHRIFERFYRVDKARSRAAGGTGLGLAIVKHIVEAHGSKVEVKSKVGEGTEFSFWLKK